MPSVLAIYGSGFEEIEFVTPVDILRRAEVRVTTAAVGGDPAPIGRSGLSVRSDIRLEELSDYTFDAVFLPGGPGVAALRQDSQVRSLVQLFMARQAWVFAICAAPLILKDAGLLSNRRYTAHTSATTELPEAIRDASVVIDGKLITSRGAGTALPFALAITAALTSPERAASIAQAICAEPR